MWTTRAAREGGILARYVPPRGAVKERTMRLKRSGIITKIIVFALIGYAVYSIFNVQAKIEEAQKERIAVQKLVNQKELSNAELEYDLENFEDPEVIIGIAREDLGLVMSGEIVFYDGAGADAGG